MFNTKKLQAKNHCFFLSIMLTVSFLALSASFVHSASAQTAENPSWVTTEVTRCVINKEKQAIDLTIKHTNTSDDKYVDYIFNKSVDISLHNPIAPCSVDLQRVTSQKENTPLDPYECGKVTFRIKPKPEVWEKILEYSYFLGEIHSKREIVFDTPYTFSVEWGYVADRNADDMP